MNTTDLKNTAQSLKENIIKKRPQIIAKLFGVGFLVLVLMIPIIMVRVLVDDRKQYRDGAVAEVSSKWGKSQTLVGPILVIPYKEKVQQEKKDKDTKTEIWVEKKSYMRFLPEKLNINGQINPKELQRGIYKVITYNGDLDFSGEFSRESLQNFKAEKTDIIWNEAKVVFFIADARGLSESISFKDWNGENKNFESGVAVDNSFNNIFGPNNSFNREKYSSFDSDGPRDYFSMSSENLSGLEVTPNLSEQNLKDKYPFSFALNFRGSEELNFLPVGSSTNIKITSPWNNPSFTGAFLPVERQINEKGFNAEWKVLQLNRNYPQSWSNELEENVAKSAFGFKLRLPVDEYQLISRSVKYAALFICLTFVVFFFVEVINKTRIHPVQYGLVGLALVLFFVLLLSLSEYWIFYKAYLAAAAAVAIMISLYSRSVMKKNNLVGLLTGLIMALYGFLYVVLVSQDYALLLGSGLLFVILAGVMWFSRKVNWYGEEA